MYQQGIKKVLINQQTIFSRLDELGEQITQDYENKDLTIISLLNGSIVFTADLLRRIRIPLKLDCWSISSYHGSKSDKFLMSPFVLCFDRQCKKKTANL